MVEGSWRYLLSQFGGVKAMRLKQRLLPRDRTRPRATRAAGVLAIALLAAACAEDSGRSTSTDAKVLGQTTIVDSSTTTAAQTTTSLSPAIHDHSDEIAAPVDPDRPNNAELKESERAALAEQLVTLREVAMRYPTLADAAAAGFEETTPYGPGLGMHMGKDAWTIPAGTPLDLTKPQSYLYNGNTPEANVVGIMFVVMGGDSPPEGFVGPLDRWHRVGAQCLSKTAFDPVFPSGGEISREVCEAADGNYLEVTAWTQHVWVVPGGEAPGGVFADTNTDIVCADGTTNSDPVTGCKPPEAVRQ